MEQPPTSMLCHLRSGQAGYVDQCDMYDMDDADEEETNKMNKAALAWLQEQGYTLCFAMVAVCVLTAILPLTMRFS
jgi:hypothetical protein